MQKHLTGELPDAAYDEIAKPVRDLIDSLSDDLVKYGLISPESAERGKGSYLTRSYAEKELQRSFGSKLFRSMNIGANKLASGMLKGRGIFKEASPQWVARQKQTGTSKTGNPIYTIKGQQWELRREYEDGGRDSILWRDYTPEERSKMGEIEDARYNVLKTLDGIAQNVESGKLFADTAADPNAAVHVPEPGHARNSRRRFGGPCCGHQDLAG